MQTFAFAPPNLGPRENQKNYVFVDEHNRHKRLKVMRACEGCRRRKIKCDAATTNTWPCSACIRLKLHCVPPTVNYDKDYASGGQGSSSDQPQDFDGSSGSGEDDYGQHPSIQQHLTGDSGSDQGYAGHVAYDETGRAYQTGPYMPQSSPQHEIPYDMNQAPRGDVAGYSYQQPAMYATSASQPMPGENGATWQQDQYAAMSLSGALGELKIDETGLAPYITRQKKSLAEAPALEEFEFNLPPTPISPGDKVRIPAELMPTDEQAMNYFNFFFQNIHPYVPVINRSYFFQQWDTNRDTISPLLLEAIFACSARLSDDPVQGAKWLALAGRHADSFMDVPRLSTLQAMLLVLKARESAPKRGYYYRSWMTVVTLVSMAKDLGLDEHYELHQAGKPCGSTLHDCITKTRVWQTLFVCEMMIGGPQGRFDMGVDPETVDLTIHPSPTLDESDFQISRQYTYFVSCVANIRRMNDVYGRVRKKPDWGSDPEFLQLNPRFTAWMHDLPQDLQVMFPPDSSPPWIPSHFIGNLNAYYNLSIIMLHRPQLAFHDSTGVSSTWRENMLQCYTAAKNMCRLQEAILQNFGLAGLLCMQRGINTAIYAVLTCTMLHLVAITSPDPEINYQAKEYFTRHMRILEQCVQSWPMPEMQAQVQALREAFSADITKPFTLKPSFPYDTPSPTVLQATSIPPDMQYRSHSDVSGHMAASAAAARANQMPYSPHPITPPISAGGLDPKGESPAQSLVMMASGSQRQQHPQQRTPLSGTSAPVHLEDPLVWNPTRIFE
ncbi:MAG: hypothetical protein M1819_002870 [Sarea resinae]|nr:MAG: hypothetical protein M1819_002870 [Sarea resinae]